MTNLRSLSQLFRAATKLAAACAFAIAIATAAPAQTNTFPGSGNAGIGTTTFDAGTSGLQIQPASRSKFGLLVTDTDGSRAGGLYIDSDGFGQLFLYDSGGTVRVHIAASSQDHTYFNSGGNVGIGTTTPSQKLNVIGNGLFGNLTSRTLIYSTYDSQQNPFLELGYGTSHSAVTPFPVFVLSNNTTSTSNGEGIIGQFVFANRSIADNNDKRTAVITSWVDGASNSGTLQFYTNSAGTVAERLRITSAGNVGIGTSSPRTKFDIKQSEDSFVGGLHLRRSSTNDTWALVTGTDNSLYMGYANNASGADAGSDFTVYPLVLTGSGKVGIGTAGPVYKLDVNGEINATGIRINGTPISGGGSSQWTTSGSSIYYNSGNVGIGTTTPAYPLTINQTGNSVNRILSLANDSSGSSAHAAVSFFEGATEKFKFGLNSSGATGYVGGVNAFQLWHFQNAPIVFGTNSSERMRIAASGNVGIGTTNPGRPLVVAADASGIPLRVYRNLNNVGYGTGINWAFNNNADNVTDYAYLNSTIVSNSAGSENGTLGFFTVKAGTMTQQAIIDQNGNVGIGTTTPAYKLDVAGEIRSSNGGFRFPDGSVQTTAATGGGGGSVTSVFGRTGAVVAAANDYTWAQINKTTSSLADITTRSAGDLSSGTLPDARFPATLPAVSGANLTSLNASNLTSGTVGATRLGSGTPNSTTFLRGDSTWTTIPSSQWANGTGNINYTDGNVGIGTSSPASGYKLDVNGNTNVTGNLNVTGSINAKYQDLAEWVPSSEQLAAGTVVVLDTTRSNQVVSSGTAYDTRVAGVISAQPGITLGEGGEGKVLVATTGRVRVKVDASRGAIQIGDLLVTSDVAGLAMKSAPVNLGGVPIHRPGTIIGKALEPLAKGSGEILVLLSLQ